MNTLIFVMGTGFLFDDNMPDDAQSIGNNTKLKDIAEIPVDVELFE